MIEAFVKQQSKISLTCQSSCGRCAVCTQLPSHALHEIRLVNHSSSFHSQHVNGFSERMDDIIQGQEPQGLFSKRSSSNILSDPRILAHLRIVAEEAQSSEKDREQDEESELQNTKREIGLKIAAYNKGNQHGAFRLILREVRASCSALSRTNILAKECMLISLRYDNRYEALFCPCLA